jgi:hypothetical protein
MTHLSELLRANKSRSTLLVLFVPSKNRFGVQIDQSRWVDEALGVLGTGFGGATAFPQARGVWRDDSRGGVLVYDEPVVIECYTNEELIEQNAEILREFLVRMGKETGQGAIGFVIDRDYLEIQFPLTE